MMMFIGTHDIQNVTINKDQRYLTVHYLENSTVMGALLHFKPDNSDTYLLYIDKEYSENFKFKSSEAKCSMSAFDIKKSGYIVQGITYPAVNRNNVSCVKSNISKLLTWFSICDKFYCILAAANYSFSKCLLKKKGVVEAMSYCICTELGTTEMYQLLLFDSSGKINVTNRNCNISITIDFKYNVSYYVTSFARRTNRASMFKPIKVIFSPDGNKCKMACKLK